MVTRILLMRHGQSEGNRDRIFQGRIDASLSAVGEKQLLMAQKRLENEKIDTVYSSPLKRALRTAEVVSKSHDLPIQICEDLAEINAGKWEGMTQVDLAKAYPEEAENWSMRPHLFCAPDGESMEEVYSRASVALHIIAEENLGKCVLVVAHGCVIRCLTCMAKSGNLEDISEISYSDNTAITEIAYEDGKMKLIAANQNEHLPKEMIKSKKERFMNFLSEDKQ